VGYNDGTYMNSNILNQKCIVSFVIGIFIGGGSMVLWLSDKPSVEIPDTAVTATSESIFAIVVADQNAGIEVHIKEVTLQKTGWVAIHESQDGSPGTVLGAQLFDVGTHSGIVDLLRGTAPGSIYYAVLHDEDGDRAFNLRKDLPLTDRMGNQIMVEFRTTSLITE